MVERLTKTAFTCVTTRRLTIVEVIMPKLAISQRANMFVIPGSLDKLESPRCPWAEVCWSSPTFGGCSIAIE